jgi:hypothetical protein
MDHGGKGLVQPAQDGCDDPPVLDPLALRALGETLGFKLLLASSHGLDKERGLPDDLLSLFGVAPLVVAVEIRHLPRGEGLGDQLAKEQLCMLGVGARQGGQHPAGGPTGDLPLTQSIEDLLRERLHERKPPAHPAEVPAQLPGDRPKRPSKTASKLPYERPLLDGLPRPLLRPAQHPCQGLIFRKRPDIRHHRVLPTAPYGLHSQVPVNENELPGFIHHRGHRRALSMALDGVGQPIKIPWPADPALSVAKNQSMEFHLFHGTDSTHIDHPESIEYSLCNHPKGSSKLRKSNRFSRLTRPSLQSHRDHKGPVGKCPK